MWLIRRLTGRLFYCLISIVIAAGLAHGQAPATTVIRDVVYRANGMPASGHVVISWPAFTTGEQRAVAAGSATVELGSGGVFEISLAPNVNATPAGSYYRVVFQLEGTPPSSETWSVPAVEETTISAVRATVMPASAAVQVASRAYVDSALAGKAASGANRDITSLSLPLLLNSGESPVVQLERGKAVFHDAGQNQVVLAVRAPTTTQTSDLFQVQDASSGNWPFFAIAPDQNVWFNVQGKGIVNGQGDVLVKSNSGNGNVQLTPNGTGTVRASSLNNVQWAGPGAIPTIDQAITACGSNPCTVYIASNYSGAESVLLTTTSTGYSVFAATNQTIVDLRANNGAVGNPGAAPLYPIQHGGRLAGQLTQFGVNRWTDGTIPDSTAGGTFFNWIGGMSPATATLPSAGDQFGLVSVLATHDSVTVGASAARLAAIDAEINAMATASDAPLPDVRAVTAGVLIPRANATQSITDATAYYAHDCVNGSTAGATIANCYGFRSDFVPASGRWGVYNKGDTLWDNSASLYAWDNPRTTPHVLFGTTSGNTVYFKPLSDTAGFFFYTVGGSSLLQLNTTNIQAGRSLVPLTADNYSLGNSTYRWTSVYTTNANIDSAGKLTATSVAIGGGTAITKHLSATATLDFPNTGASSCSDLTMTVTGAAAGDTVAPGIPAGSVPAGGFFSAWVSAANTVTVRFCTMSSGNPASGTFRLDVWKH